MTSQIRNARIAVLVSFALCGFNFANWASRLPVVESKLNLSAQGLGLLLLFASGGSLTAVPVSGALTDRIGTARVVRIMAVVMTAGLVGATTAVTAGSTVFAALSLYVMGLGMGSWDVAMNVEGAIVEHEIQKSVMAQFHAGWSLGTVAGAGTGALMAATGVPIHFHLYGVLVFSLLAVLVAVRHYLPISAREAMSEASEAADISNTANPGGAVQTLPRVRSPWLESRTLLIGVLVLAATLTEGAANDWIAVAVKSEMTSGLTERASEAVGALSLGIFLTAMTAMRLFGNGLLDRHGRVFVLRLSASFGVVGLLFFGLSPWYWLAAIGIGFWGLGSALGFPVGMSAASDDPIRAARRVAVVASIGYTSFLAGPPFVGFIAEALGYRNSLLLIAIPMAIGFVIASKAAPLPGSRREIYEENLRK